jgi:hypothetical protein
MISRTIAQAIYQDGRPLVHSDDFDEGWQSEVERIVAGFGLPPGTSAPECMFAVPFAHRRVAVVSVTGRRFRFLILSRALYEVIPDPFAIVDQFPPSPEPLTSLSTLEWPEEPLPLRTVAKLDSIFKTGDGPFLLGACQTLVDSGRIMLRRDAPDPELCQNLWDLLPDSIRRQTWVATFAYSTELGFGLVALPAIPENGIVGYLTEDQARDYPESRYERELQVAVEHNDQRTVDRLFARRSSSETLRLALWIVLAAIILSLAMRLLQI